MSPAQTNLLQGTLDLLILKALALGELHGLGVARRVEQLTKGAFQVKPGSLFPALHRMEEAGWLAYLGRDRDGAAGDLRRGRDRDRAARWCAAHC